MIRNGQFAGLILLLLTAAAIAFAGKFRNNGDQLDELELALGALVWIVIRVAPAGI